MEELGYKMSDLEKIKPFITGGKAYFSIRSSKTGNHFTFRITKPKKFLRETSPVFWVSVLKAPGHRRQYSYIGHIANSGKLHFKPSPKVEGMDPEKTAFRWFAHQLNETALPETIEFWHHGRCCQCGRRLTDPASIEKGIGPECGGRRK